MKKRHCLMYEGESEHFNFDLILDLYLEILSFCNVLTTWRSLCNFNVNCTDTILNTIIEAIQ